MEKEPPLRGRISYGDSQTSPGSRVIVHTWAVESSAIRLAFFDKTSSSNLRLESLTSYLHDISVLRNVLEASHPLA